MGFFEGLLGIIMYTLGFYLLINCCYLLFFAVAGLKTIPPLSINVTKYRQFCILIPAYKADDVVLETSRRAMKHQYPGIFHVFVIADGLRDPTIKKLKENGVGVIEVSFKRSTKGKALLAAISALEKEYDLVMILDVDNIMNENVLADVNLAFEAGYRVVQTHRTAKNYDTPFSFLDSCNEEISNHIFRKGPAALGLSSALIGSGMAFEYNYFKKIISDIGEVVGEDKEMDFRIAKDKIKVAYLQHVFVFDEKVENARDFKRQRTRWIYSQLEVLKKYSREVFFQFRNGNVEFMNKLMQAWLVPRTILMTALVIFILVSLVVPFGPPSFFWLSLLVILFAALLMSMPRHYSKNKMLAKAIIRLPSAIVSMAGGFFGLHKTKRSYMATPHKAAVSSKINH